MTDTAETLSKLRTYAGFTLSSALCLLAAGLLSCQAVIWLQPLSPVLSLIEQFRRTCSASRRSACYARSRCAAGFRLRSS